MDFSYLWGQSMIVFVTDRQTDRNTSTGGGKTSTQGACNNEKLYRYSQKGRKHNTHITCAAAERMWYGQPCSSSSGRLCSRQKWIRSRRQTKVRKGEVISWFVEADQSDRSNKPPPIRLRLKLEYAIYTGSDATLLTSSSDSSFV